MVAIVAQNEPDPALPTTLGETLERVLEQARSLPLEAGEALERDPDRHSLIPQLRFLVRRAIELLHLAETGASASANAPPLWLVAVAISPDRLLRLADLAALARSGLEPFERWLDEGRFDSGAQDRLERVGRARAALLSGLGALLEELRELVGAGPFPPAAGMAALLNVRRAVTRLRRGLQDAERTYPGDLDMQLRSAGTGLVRLIGREELETSRPLEHWRARELRDRVLAWVKSPRADVVAGVALAAALQRFAIGLAEVNQDPELVAHDLAAIRELVRILLRSEPHESLSCTLVEKLYALFGRDDRLDLLVVAGADRAQVLARLLEIRRSLAPSRA